MHCRPANVLLPLVFNNPAVLVRSLQRWVPRGGWGSMRLKVERLLTALHVADMPGAGNYYRG